MKWNRMPVFLILLLLFSCNTREQIVLRILTDQADFIPVAEFYNSRQEQIRLIPLYKDYLTEDEIKSLEPDLLISRDLGNQSFDSILKPIQMPALWEEKIYSSLIENQIQSEKIYAIPLSFDLPVILYREDYFSQEMPPFMISPQQLMDLTEKDLQEGPLKHLTFSPLWEKSYLRYYLQLQGENFTDGQDFAYNAEDLQSTLDEQKVWLEETLEGRGKAFSIKYRYIPDIQLLHQGRLDFVCMGLQEFLSYQESIRKGLQFSYLALHGKIRPDSVLYASLTRKGSRYETECVEVLDTLLDQNFQNDFLNWKITLRDESFAYMEGLSSLSDINQYILPQVYKELDSRIFQPDQLLPVLETPPYWSALSEEVVETWLSRYMNGENSQNLMDFYNDWELQFIP